ncbi:MAG: PP2C family protein-serine/threonine phosphatase [Bacteroidia bacterium]|nr:serine/threonine-protein phosphatase [Bacteroidia bacterium]MDW8134172.1 PP2C family protein-serine/threonine phosphatase [Bacteroidia bacterium]
MIIGRAVAPLLLTLGAAFALLYLWVRYFAPYSYVEPLGLAAFLGVWAGGYLLFGEHIPRRWRSPERLLRWNAVLAGIGMTHVILWGLLGLAVSPANVRLRALLEGISEVGIAFQSAGHLILTGYLILYSFRWEKLWVLIGFYALSAIILSLRTILPSTASYLTPLVWLGILPLLYFSQWIEKILNQRLGETLLLVGAALVGTFLGWHVLPPMLMVGKTPLYAVLYPLLLAIIFLHGGWLIIPPMLRLVRVSQSEYASFELLTEFLAKQQRTNSAREILQITSQTLGQIPGVGGVFIELRTPFEDSVIVSHFLPPSLQESLRQILHQKSATESYIEVLPSLQRLNPKLPNLAGIFSQKSLSLLQGSALSQTLSLAVVSRIPDGFEEKDINLILTIAEQTVLFLEHLERRAYQEQALTARKEADFLKQTREALLPPAPPSLKKIDFYVLFEQYDRTIGGDYYQIHEYDGGEVVDFWLSDCAGSGIAAAYQMAQARGALNALWMRQLSPDAFILELNDTLKRIFHKNNFLAATLLRFDLKRKEYVIVRAGNPEVFHWNPLTNQTEILRPSGIVLGTTSSQIVGRIIVPERGHLVPGSLFMCFSDGFTEATSPSGEMFGGERLFKLFSTYHTLTAKEIATRIFQEVRTFTEGYSLGDDGTLLVVRYTG